MIKKRRKKRNSEYFKVFTTFQLHTSTTDRESFSPCQKKWLKVMWRWKKLSLTQSLREKWESRKYARLPKREQSTFRHGLRGMAASLGCLLMPLHAVVPVFGIICKSIFQSNRLIYKWYSLVVFCMWVRNLNNNMTLTRQDKDTTVHRWGVKYQSELTSLFLNIYGKRKCLMLPKLQPRARNEST